MSNFRYLVKLRHGISYTKAKTTTFRNVHNLQAFLLMIEQDLDKWYWFNVYSMQNGMQLAAYTPKFPPSDIGVTEDEFRRMYAKRLKEKQRKKEKVVYERILFN